MIQAAFSKPEFHGYILEKNLMEGIPCQGQHCANHAAETRQALVPFIWDSAVDFFKTEEAPFIQLISLRSGFPSPQHVNVCTSKKN
jgi:hypothetical protein